MNDGEAADDGEAPIAMVGFQLLLMASKWLVNCAVVGDLDLCSSVTNRGK